ncbi:VOC family protein [Allopontixanthobacter sediminis]|uniref:Glyoxalase n=1 Tax=Allopontixanthobacter sediminis TaxID=1689985 RepID=A0A845B5V1_9SPHN|nr:VOC family protein [Allopontixanthobacter sediminis]MXP45740.1 glyoxalase [Allopontixanthobacter sediminis]
MTILGIDHVQLAMPVGAEDTAREFYHGVLGLAETAKPADLAQRGGCWFVGGNAHIHLGAEQDFSPASKAHPALLVEDFDAFAERLAKHGCDITPGKPLAGYKRGDIVDPFGNRIELMQRV